jgi:surfeit locus 1 family protein
MKLSKVFSRRMLVLCLALLGMVVTATMGQWQLRRAAQKQALTEARQAQSALAPIDGQSLGQAGDSPANREGLIYRAAHLQGRWLPQHTVFLENRQMRGRTGFFVVTPMRLNGGAVVLVQRGWVPRNFNDRTSLPSVSTPEGEVSINGHLAPWPSRMYDFGALEQGAIRQNLEFDAYRQQTGLPLLELSVQQSEGDQDGLVRDWPVVASGVEKHYGYAFQWFGLCVLIAVLYVWFQIVQPRRKQNHR